MRIRPHGSRTPIALLLAATIALAAGCGGDSGGNADDLAAVEAEVTALGTTQNISCEELGEEEVGGVERLVYTCGFDEEEPGGAGEMRTARRCFVVDGSDVQDVTAELRDRGACPVTSE